MAFVGAERDREVVLVAEALDRLDRVGGDTEHAGAGLVEGLGQPRKVDRLLGAARGVGARIEIQDEHSPLEIGERDLAAAVAGKR